MNGIMSRTMRNGGRSRIALLSGIIVSIHTHNDSTASILICQFKVQERRSAIRASKATWNRTSIYKTALVCIRHRHGRNPIIALSNIPFIEPLGLHSIGPQNLLDRNSSSVDHESLSTGVQDYNSMFREPWVPCDPTKPPTSLDMAWSSMPDSTSTPPAQHFPYAYLNLFQPNLPSNNSHTPNSSNPDSLLSGLGLQTLYSSASSVSFTYSAKFHDSSDAFHRVAATASGLGPGAYGGASFAAGDIRDLKRLHQAPDASQASSERSRPIGTISKRSYHSQKGAQATGR